MPWRPYLKDRLIEEREGFVVIVPTDAPEVIPLFCGVCDHAMRTRDDEEAHRGFGCCSWCARRWAEPRREAWHAGWRPSGEQVEGAELERPPLSVDLKIM